jgi:hypothetical protein
MIEKKNTRTPNGSSIESLERFPKNETARNIRTNKNKPNTIARKHPTDPIPSPSPSPQNLSDGRS